MQTIALAHMSKAKATIQDIARELNVTTSTVSRALHGHAAISDATKKAVWQTAKKLNYRPNTIASSLRLGKSRILGVIIPSTDISFFGAVIHGIEKVASSNGYTILIYQSNEMPLFEEKGIETFLRSRVDGVLASISKETKKLDHYLEIKKHGVPLVLFDRADDSLLVPSVVVDDYHGAYMATRHLIDQGCRRLAHIAGQQHVTIFKQRLKGFANAIKDSGLPLGKDCIVYGKVTIESGYACMQKLLALKQPPDGVFAVEDFTALGAMQAIKAVGRKIPDEIALIGFANASFGEYVSPSLSTVDQQATKMGEEAAQLFFSLSEKDGFYESPPRKLVLEPVLLYRKSSLRNG
jgi:LacI family transcriptional regulator